jgi:stage II sporulation protein M
LAWSVIAINFSVYVITGRNSSLPLGRAVFAYTTLALVYLLIMLAGTFVEAYLSPWLLSLVI